jgi:hypothetical protein
VLIKYKFDWLTSDLNPVNPGIEVVTAFMYISPGFRMKGGPIGRYYNLFLLMINKLK